MNISIPFRRSAADASPPRDGEIEPRHQTGLMVDLERRRDQLVASVAELQWDLGGLAYEMATRNSIHVEVLASRAAILQSADAELSEVERLVRSEQTGVAGGCSTCGAPHSSGATFCWQCGGRAARAGPQRRDRPLAEPTRDVVARARVGRASEDRLGVGDLDQGPDRGAGVAAIEAEEGGLIGDPRGLLHVVGDDHDREPPFEAVDQVLDRRGRDRVERRCRLVEEQDVGFDRDRAGDAEPLLLAAGEARARCP